MPMFTKTTELIISTILRTGLRHIAILQAKTVAR